MVALVFKQVMKNCQQLTSRKNYIGKYNDILYEK